MGSSYSVSSNNRIFAFSSDMKPVLVVQNGSEVVFETMDCFSNQIRTAKDRLENLNWAESTQQRVLFL